MQKTEGKKLLLSTSTTQVLLIALVIWTEILGQEIPQFTREVEVVTATNTVVQTVERLFLLTKNGEVVEFDKDGNRKESP